MVISVPTVPAVRKGLVGFRALAQWRSAAREIVMFAALGADDDGQSDCRAGEKRCVKRRDLQCHDWVPPWLDDTPGRRSANGQIDMSSKNPVISR
jgi:hypothetical protein